MPKNPKIKSVLIIGSGAVVHNIKLASSKMFSGDTQRYGWDTEFDEWVKQKVDDRDIKSLIAYENNKYGK